MISLSILEITQKDLFQKAIFLFLIFSKVVLVIRLSTVEVSSIILSLNQSTSVGPNSIPIRLLKILNSEISNPLAMIINESFSSGTLPDKLKIAKFTTIFKKGSKSDKKQP